MNKLSQTQTRQGERASRGLRPTLRRHKVWETDSERQVAERPDEGMVSTLQFARADADNSPARVATQATADGGAAWLERVQPQM